MGTFKGSRLGFLNEALALTNINNLKISFRKEQNKWPPGGPLGPVLEQHDEPTEGPLGSALKA